MDVHALLKRPFLWLGVLRTSCIERNSLPARRLVLFVLSAACLSQVETSSSAAEDPARFTAVPSWEAQVSISVVSAGDFPDVSWSVNRSVSFTNTLRSGFELIGPILGWGGDGSPIDPSQFSVEDRITIRQDPEDPMEISCNRVLSEPYPPQGAGFLEINLTDRTYTLDFSAAYVCSFTVDGTTAPTACALGSLIWGYTSFPLPETGLVLSQTYTFPVDRYCDLSNISCNDCILGLAAVLGIPDVPGTVQVTWTLKPQELELVVEPDGYRHWLPEGNLDDPERRGNSIKISAKLQAKGGGPTSERAETIYFELITNSANPGVCMNYPAASPSHRADLRFEFDMNPPKPGTTVAADDSLLGIFSNSEDGIAEADAVLSSFDFGAYGELRVTAEVNGIEIVGYLKGSAPNLEDIPFPKCQPGSQIADIWKERHGLGTHQDGEDTDDLPAGDGHDGDGFSLYEEYRGFSEDRVHLRTDPSKKDLFIRDEICTAAVKSAIAKAQSVSHLNIHHKLRKDEIADRVININHGYAHQGFHQHGLILVGRQVKTSFSEAIQDERYRNGYSTPGSVIRLEIDPTDKKKGAGPMLYEARAVPHEIMHACAVSHHGECDINASDEIDVYWGEKGDGSHIEGRRIRGGTGSVIPVVISLPEGGPAKMDWSEEHDGNLIIKKRWLAVPHGQHSGDTRCIMAYAYADGFLRDYSNKRYQVAFWPSGVQNHLCTSPTGTGVNSSGTFGGSWLGSAYQGGSANQNRGNCARQICVNDRHLADTTKHIRMYTCEQW